MSARTLLAALCLASVSADAQSSERVGFRAELSSDTVYVGQQLTYALSVRIPTEVRQRLRRNPEFVPPDPRSMLAYDLPLSRTADPAAAIEVHTFRRALFVLTPGRYTIGAARLSYALPQSASFFSREEERTLRSDAVSFVALEPPARGRPATWLGAVGQWTATARAEPSVARVGDPFVLVLRLAGEGNATLLPRPALSIPWADIVVQDERVVLDSTPVLLGGVKEFRWLVTPRTAGAQLVPPIEYAYFDPAARRYAVARTVPLPISVRAGTLVEVPLRAADIGDTVPMPLRASLRGPVAVRVPGGLWWVWLAALAPLPWALRRFAPRRRVAARLEARVAARATVREADRTARATLEGGLRARTGVEVAAFTDRGALAAALRLEGVTPDTAAAAEALRDECDARGFGRARASGSDAALRARATALLARVDAEARKRFVAVVALCCALAVGGCVASDGSTEVALQAFTDGRTAYVGRDFARSRNAFLAASRAAPRDPNVWANVGAAAWQAGDTATAVYGWQRALRLDPRDTRVRERLLRARAPQGRGAARVWPVPPLPLAVVAFLLWGGGWAWAAGSVRGRRTSRWPLLAIIPGTALALLAWRLDHELAARDLVVLAEPTPLRSLPALGADLGAMPLAGEVARVRERRGVWLQVELAGDREGWYPTERTWSLARD